MGNVQGLRGQGAALPPSREPVGLPTRVFLFTVDQLAVMLNMSEETIKKYHLFYEGRTVGSRKRNLMVARNIAPEDEKPDWRVAEREFIRWMKVKGFRHYDRGAFTN